MHQGQNFQILLLQIERYGFATDKKIDVTNYKYLKCVLDVSISKYNSVEANNTDGNAEVDIGLYNSTTDGFHDNALKAHARIDYGEAGGSATNTTMTLDVSNITGSYYICFQAHANLNAYNAEIDAKIYRIYLQR